MGRYCVACMVAYYNSHVVRYEMHVLHECLYRITEVKGGVNNENVQCVSNSSWFYSMALGDTMGV